MVTGFEPIHIGSECFAKTKKSLKNKTRYQSGFQNVVDLPVQFSNRFRFDLRHLADLAV